MNRKSIPLSGALHWCSCIKKTPLPRKKDEKRQRGVYGVRFAERVYIVTEVFLLVNISL